MEQYIVLAAIFRILPDILSRPAALRFNNPFNSLTDVMRYVRARADARSALG